MEGCFSTSPTRLLSCRHVSEDLRVAHHRAVQFVPRKLVFLRFVNLTTEEPQNTKHLRSICVSDEGRDIQRVKPRLQHNSDRGSSIMPTQRAPRRMHVHLALQWRTGTAASFCMASPLMRSENTSVSRRGPLYPRVNQTRIELGLTRKSFAARRQPIDGDGAREIGTRVYPRTCAQVLSGAELA